MKNYKKFIAGAVAIAISAGTTTTIAFAKNSDNNDNASESSASSQKSENTNTRAPKDSSAYKDETVYVLCESNSKVKNVIVSDWLKNSPSLDSIEDISSLADIVNVKGDEEFTSDGTQLNWDADGKDIYYKGTTDKELPVDVNITYFLDGREISPADLAGKSGHVTIRWDYKNKQKVTKEINGKKNRCLRIANTLLNVREISPEILS